MSEIVKMKAIGNPNFQLDVKTVPGLPSLLMNDRIEGGSRCEDSTTDGGQSDWMDVGIASDAGSVIVGGGGGNMTKNSSKVVETYDLKIGEYLVVASIQQSDPVPVVNASERNPVEMCVVVDISGSMGTEASFQNAEGKTESSGLSYLDVVKHAVRTIINILQPFDRLGLVSFHSNAKVEMEMTLMTEAGKKTAEKCLDALHPLNSTNLWDGLKSGLDLMKDSKNGSLLLLTDGLPNVEPPRGHQQAFKAYMEKNGLPCVCHMFGFGYCLNSPLLEELASLGRGSYCFLPDSGFVGTAFINATSNILSIVAKDSSVSIEEDGENIEIVEVLGGLDYDRASWGVQVRLGNLSHGESRDLVLKLKKRDERSDKGNEISFSLKYSYMDVDPANEEELVVVPVNTNGVDNLVVHRISEMADLQSPLRSQVSRVFFVDLLKELLAQVFPRGNLARDPQLSIERKKYLGCLESALSAVLKEFPEESHPFKNVSALVEDIEGQVSIALSRDDWCNKWGRHYLLSLRQAHQLQRCNNFKDPGVQVYGGKLFNELRDIADRIFDTMPPPKPNPQVRGGHHQQSYVSMSHWNCASNGCFHGSSLVSCFAQDGTKISKPANQVKKGDILAPNHSKVVCVVRTKVHYQEVMRLSNNVIITPYHPVSFGVGESSMEWIFPLNADKSRLESLIGRDYIYSFVLSDGGYFFMGENDVVAVISLGHKLSCPSPSPSSSYIGTLKHVGALDHAYFGSSRVLDDLKVMQGWEEGLIELQDGCVVKDPISQKACKMVQKQMVAVN